VGSVTMLACPPRDVMVWAAKALLEDDRAWDGIPLARGLAKQATSCHDLALDDAQLDQLAQRIDAIPELEAILVAKEDRGSLPFLVGLPKAAGTDGALEVVVFSTGRPWHQTSLRLVGHPVEGLDPSPRIVSRRVDEHDIGGSLGNVFADAVPEATEARPVALLAPGSSLLDRSFDRLVELWALQAHTVSPAGVRVNRRVAAPAGDDLLVSAMNRALIWGTGIGGPEHLAVDGMDVLVDATGQVTRSLLRLLAEERATASSHSACADLLDQMGSEGEDYARQLRELVDHWIRNRIWDHSMVHEMVLHDAVHSAHVDRNIASMAVTLVHRDRLTAYEVFVLAVSAWLHDWGHSSTEIDAEVPTLPAEVRTFHGPLSAYKILENREKEHHRLHDHDARRDVALLCAHHQGWTSCDGQDATPTKTESGVLSKNTLFLVGNPLTSFRKDFDVLAMGGPGLLNYDRAQMLLALLRVADAADMGQHRVPHRDSRRQSHALLLKQLLPDLQTAAEGVKALEKVNTAHVEIEGALDRQGARNEEEIDALIEEHLGGVPGWVRNDSVPAPAVVSDGLRSRTRDLWKYAKHLARQRSYFDQHAGIRHVVPILQPTLDDDLLITLHVMTRADLDPEAAKVALDTVANSVWRELGKEGDDHDRKGGIPLALDRLGIKNDVRVKRIPHAEVEVIDEEVAPLGPRGRRCVQQIDDGRHVRHQFDGAGMLVRKWLNTVDQDLGPDVDLTATLAATPDGAVLAWCRDGSLGVYLCEPGDRYTDLKLTTPVLVAADDGTGAVDTAQQVLAIARYNHGYRVVVSSDSAAWDYHLAHGVPATRKALVYPLSDAAIVGNESRYLTLRPQETVDNSMDVFPGMTIEAIDVCATDTSRVYGAIGVDLFEQSYLLRCDERAGANTLKREPLAVPHASVVVVRGSSETASPDVLAFGPDGSLIQRLAAGVST